MRGLSRGAWAVAVAALARADLPVGGTRRCGDISCEQDFYCHAFDLHCRPCREVCVAGNNFDEATCQRECQAFIHDQRYVSRNEDIIQQLTRKVQVLTVVSTVALALAVLALVLCLGHVGRMTRLRSLWRLTKDKVKSGGRGDAAEAEAGHKGAVATLKLDVRQLPRVPSASPPLSRSASHEPPTPATTSTPLSRPRHPSEDNTLDYAYDNPVLAPSPPPPSSTPSPPQHKESSF